MREAFSATAGKLIHAPSATGHDDTKHEVANGIVLRLHSDDQ